jgi:Tfp pilus assembly protein PilF
VRHRLAAVLLAVLTAAGYIPSAHAQRTEADVYAAQAVLDFEDRRYDAALQNLRRALELEPDHLDALYYTGLVHLAQQRPAEAVPFLERARARAPQDPIVAFQLGLAFFAQQSYDRAQPLLEEAFRAQPALDGLGYYVGFMRYRNKDYQGAVNAFRASRARDPEIQQLTRLYTGLALAVLGLPSQAAAQVEEGLRLAPGSALTGPAERLRDSIVAARERQKRLTLEARLGFFYDDNVAVVPESSVREPLTRLLRDRDHTSTGELFGLRAEYVFYREAGLDLSAGYSFFATYNNDLPDFNVTSHLGTLGTAYTTTFLGRPMQLGSQYAFDILFLNEDEFIRRHTVTAFAALVASDQHLTQVFGRYQRKDFAEAPPRPPSEEIRDANNVMVGAIHLLRFAQDRHFLKAGYQFDVEDTEGRNYAYYGHRLLVGGQYTVPWSPFAVAAGSSQGHLRLRYDLDVHFRDYLHRNTILPTGRQGTLRRHDKEITNVVRAELPLPNLLGAVGAPAWGGFTLSGEYQSTINLSNVDVFDYRRNVLSLILSWAY